MGFCDNLWVLLKGLESVCGVLKVVVFVCVPCVIGDCYHMFNLLILVIHWKWVMGLLGFVCMLESLVNIDCIYAVVGI